MCWEQIRACFTMCCSGTPGFCGNKETLVEEEVNPEDMPSSSKAKNPVEFTGPIYIKNDSQPTPPEMLHPNPESIKHSEYKLDEGIIDGTKEDAQNLMTDDNPNYGTFEEGSENKDEQPAQE